MDLKDRPRTIFLDVDGSILKHTGDIIQQPSCIPDVLPGVLQKLREWDLKGYKLILVTGRKESCRKQTEEQLAKVGIHYDMLVMGITSGQRVLINDLKANSQEPTAVAINIERNKGLNDIDI